MNSVLITGGSGYIGHYLVELFKRKNWEVFITSRSNKNYQNVLYMDLLKDDTINNVCKNIDVVIHLANLDERLIEQKSKEALIANSYATRNLYLDAIKHDVKRFIYFSTFHVYGKKEGNITERTIPQPMSDYGMTHYFAEKYLEQLANEKTKVDIIRLTNGVGVPFGVDKWYLVLNDFCKTIKETGKIILKSNGLPLRDFVALKDVSDAVACILGNNEANNLNKIDVFNISGEMTYSIRDIALLVQEIYEKRYNKKAVTNFPSVTQKEIDDIKPLFVSSEKLRSLGWKSKYSIEDVVNDIFSYLDNRG